MAQNVDDAVEGLRAAAVAAFAPVTDAAGGEPVYVTIGQPAYFPPLLAMIGTEIREEITRPTMGPRRSRESSVDVECVFSVLIGGGEEAAPVALSAARNLTALLEDYLRVAPHETLGGACRDSWLSSSRANPYVAYQDNGEPGTDPMPVGRACDVTAVVTLIVRH